MNRASLAALVRSVSWKEWVGLIIITGWHIAQGSNYGLIGLTIGLVLGLCVALALVMAWRVVSEADRKKKDAQ